MRIKEIKSQHRRDFKAIFECEHCGATEEKGGYDDAYYHNEVIPNMECKECGKKSPKDYIPNATKYPEGYQV